MKKIFLALSLTLMGSTAFAACEFDVGVGDTLVYDTESIEVDASCDSVTINLTHSGALPAAAMGHNWVLAASADVDALATAGMASGLEGNYLPADDDRIIASTKIIGGGESTTLTFSVAELDKAGDYTFFCSFPGHWAVMRGAFKLS